MTEWWVSQAKHWCTICRVWTGGHKGQILKHEGGRAHIENEERSIKDAATRNRTRNKEEQDVKEQLAEIERKALEAMAKDIAPPPPRPGVGADWQRPAGGAALTADFVKLDQAAQRKQIEEVVADAKRRRVDPNCDAWTKHVDPNSKVTYYYNTVTKASSWEVPEGFVEAVAIAPAAARDGPSANGSPWTASTDPTSGVQYYYNSVTKESSWVRPADFDDPATPAAAAAVATPRVCAIRTDAPMLAPRTVSVGGPELSPELAGAPITAAAPPIRSAATAAHMGAGSPIAQAGAGSPWVVCTDPDSGYVYYFNKLTKTSTYDVPADLGVDLSRPPPPPSSKPPPPPKKAGSASSTTMAVDVGAWEEVKPEASQWQAPQGADSDESEEEKVLDPVVEMKFLMMNQRGDKMDEDHERHEVETIQKKSSVGSTSEKVSFPMKRMKASGLRKRDDETDFRCV